MSEEKIEIGELKQKIRTFLEVKKSLTTDSCHFITKQLSEEYWEQWQEEIEETDEEELETDEIEDNEVEEPEDDEEEDIAEPVEEPKTIKPKSIRRLPPKKELPHKLPHKLPVKKEKPEITQDDIDKGDF